jgi:DNA-binding CsgD family transcriptional regulator
MTYVLGWSAEHDLDTALRLMVALGWWWMLRGRLASQEPLLRELADRAEPGSQGWCVARFWLCWAAVDAADLAGALRWCTAVVDMTGGREPSQPLVDSLIMQSTVLTNLGRVPEAVAAGRRALALAQQLGYQFGQASAMTCLSRAASCSGDLDEAVLLARQAGQIPDMPAKAARVRGYELAAALADSGNLPAAEQACVATLAQARDAGDLDSLSQLLVVMADLDLQAGRAGEAAACLREAAQIALQAGGSFTMLDILDSCGLLCAATGRPADAITAWAASETLGHQGGLESTDTDPYARRLERSRRRTLEVLGPAHASAAQHRGAEMSLATASEYALMLTLTDPPQPPTVGQGKLSARERELVTLVAQGRTDAQIAKQLYISNRTVRSHLDRIRDKTSCRRRADLTRLALAEGLV